jgi:GH25 family lysozyme M1 (1,4-beta-N-acetylmuramidase)
VIEFADISEYQPAFDARKYRDAGNQVIVARVHNGYRPDRMMPGRIAQIRSVNFTAAGWYIYLVKIRDPVVQVTEAIGVIGKLKANEFAIVDHEEGAGSQVARCQQACRTFDRWAGFPCTLYAGQAFYSDHLGGVARWRRPRWIAKYLDSHRPDMAAYPAGATFWQYSDRGRFTGLPGNVDANIYPGTARRFLADVRAGAPPPAGSVRRDEVAVGVRPDGRREVFVRDADGIVWHRLQGRSGWTGGWQQLGKPGG